jgi:hypothetical protein
VRRRNIPNLWLSRLIVRLVRLQFVTSRHDVPNRRAWRSPRLRRPARIVPDKAPLCRVTNQITPREKAMAHLPRQARNRTAMAGGPIIEKSASAVVVAMSARGAQHHLEHPSRCILTPRLPIEQRERVRGLHRDIRNRLRRKTATKRRSLSSKTAVAVVAVSHLPGASVRHRDPSIIQRVQAVHCRPVAPA